MIPEWPFTPITTPPEFYKLLQYYLTVPFTGNSTDTAILSEFWDTVLNHPLWLEVIVLFVLLLCGSLLATDMAIASKTYREKKEQMKRYLAKHKRQVDEKLSLDYNTLEEREEFDRG